MTISDYVKKYDPQNQFSVLVNSYEQIEYSWQNEINVESINSEKINNVIVSGLGGSAIGGDLFLNYTLGELNLPYSVNRHYDLPNYADEKTLLIVSSYSGNTEETISAMKDGLKRKCQIIAITTGGEIEKLAVENNVPVFKLKPGYQPRYALYINIFALLKIMQTLKLIPNQDEMVNEVIDFIKSKGIEYSVENNKPIDLAESLIGFVPLIYSEQQFTSTVGNRLKGQFNENSKMHAFHNIIPELNHNEIIGWETFTDSNFNAKLIMILDQSYNEQVKKRFDVTREIVEKTGVEIIPLHSNEEKFKMRLIDLVYLGDWLTYYLAVLRGHDPSEIDNIIYLKEKLAEQKT